MVPPPRKKPTSFVLISLGIAVAELAVAGTFLTWQAADAGEQLDAVIKQATPGQSMEYITALHAANVAVNKVLGTFLVTGLVLAIGAIVSALMLRGPGISAGVPLPILLGIIAGLAAVLGLVNYISYASLLQQPITDRAFALLPFSFAGKKGAPWGLFFGFLGFAALYAVFFIRVVRRRFGVAGKGSQAAAAMRANRPSSAHG